MAVTADNKIKAPWTELYKAICFPSYQSFGILPPVLPPLGKLKAHVVTALKSPQVTINSQLLVAAFKSEIALKGYSETGIFKRDLEGNNTYIQPGYYLNKLAKDILQNNDETLLILLSRDSRALSVEAVYNILMSCTENSQTQLKQLYLKPVQSISFYKDWDKTYEYFNAIKSRQDTGAFANSVNFNEEPEKFAQILTGALYMAIINREFRAAQEILAKNLPFDEQMLMYVIKELIFSRHDELALFLLGHSQLFLTPSGYPASTILELMVYAANEGSEDVFHFILENFPINPTNGELDEWSKAISTNYHHLCLSLRSHYSAVVITSAAYQQQFVQS